MKVNLNNVRQKSILIDKLPFIGHGTCTAVYPNVYLSRKAYKNIHSRKPDHHYIAVVIHEQEHINRMKTIGVIRWNIGYLVSRRFRLEEELAAVRPQIEYLALYNLEYDVEAKAKSLSSWLYLWPISYDKALISLDKIKKQTMQTSK